MVCVFLYSKFQSRIFWHAGLIHSLGWLDCFWVDDLGYTSLKLIYIYIYSTWTSSTTPKRKYDELTNPTWSENKHIFVWPGGRNWGKFQVGFGSMKKISADGIVWFNQFKDPLQTRFGVQRNLESQNPKGKQHIFGRIGVSDQSEQFLHPSRGVFFCWLGFSGCRRNFRSVFFFCRGADQSSSTAEGGEGAKEVWRGFSSEMGVFLSLKNQALLR